MQDAPGLIWDACALLNLLATDRAQEIVRSLGSLSFVVRQVRELEVLYLRPLPEEDQTGQLLPVDLTSMIEAGDLQLVELTREELVQYVALAAEMDDGEAQSAAVAMCRKWWLVTDDRVSLRVVRSLSDPVPTVTTPEWIKFWAESTAVSGSDLAAVLRRIQLCASYFPRRTHPLREWWEEKLSSA